jgi:hypothetical protein
MRIKKFWQTLSTFAALNLLALLTGCCDQSIELAVLVGHKTGDDCVKARRQGKTSPVTYQCPGEEVTVCWASENVNSIKIDPLGNFGSQGVEYFKPGGTTTVTASSLDNDACAASRSVSVNVVDHPTPSAWTGTWDARCQLVSYNIDPLFVSSQVNAIDDVALWQPILQVTNPDGSSGPVLCKTPPFLQGFHVQDVFGFNINEPNVTVAFPRPHPADGDWNYKLVAQCPQGDFKCNPQGSYEFDMTLSCKQP